MIKSAVAVGHFTVQSCLLRSESLVLLLLQGRKGKIVLAQVLFLLSLLLRNMVQV